MESITVLATSVVFILIRLLEQSQMTYSSDLLDPPLSIINFSSLKPHSSKQRSNIPARGINLVVRGAGLNEPCNETFHIKLVVPLYKADDRDTLFAAAEAINFELQASNFSIEPFSCFTRIPSETKKPEKIIFMECVESGSGSGQSTSTQSSVGNGTGNHVCVCNTKEPFISKINSRTNECELEAPTLGTPCWTDRYNALNERFFGTMRDGLEKAKTSQDVINTLNSFKQAFQEYVEYFSIPGDLRYTCFNLHNHYPSKVVDFNIQNLVCSPQGNCTCLKHSPRLTYAHKDGYCYAEKNSICILKAESPNYEYHLSNATCLDINLDCGPIDGIRINQGTKVSITSCGGTGRARRNISTKVDQPMFLMAIMLLCCQFYVRQLVIYQI